MTILLHTISRTIAAAAAASVFGAAIATAAPISNGAAGDDCYNRVTQACNAKYPGKDWGDVHYRDCINQGLNKCDAEEPLTLGTPKIPGIFGRVAPLTFGVGR